MTDEKEQWYINKIHALEGTLIEDSKYFHLLRKLIPFFGRYEDLAVIMSNAMGLRKALKFAVKVDLKKG